MKFNQIASKMLKSVASLIHIKGVLRGFFTTVSGFGGFFLPHLLSKSLVFISDFRTTAALIGNEFCNHPH